MEPITFFLLKIMLVDTNDIFNKYSVMGNINFYPRDR